MTVLVVPLIFVFTALTVLVFAVGCPAAAGAAVLGPAHADRRRPGVPDRPANNHGHQRLGDHEANERPARVVVRDPGRGDRAGGRHGVPGRGRGAGAERLAARPGVRADPVMLQPAGGPDPAVLPRSPGSWSAVACCPTSAAAAGPSWPAPEGRARLARSLRLALEDGGVTFVKLGQVLSTRRDLLPRPSSSPSCPGCRTMPPQVPWPQDGGQVLRTELGAGVDEVFVTFEREPLAAASIAQVHAATHPGRRSVGWWSRSAGDRTSAQVVDRDLDIVRPARGPAAARHQLGPVRGCGHGLAYGFADALREELDLRIEARNMTAVAAAAGPAWPATRHQPVRVPTPYQPLCTGKRSWSWTTLGRPPAGRRSDAGLAAPTRGPRSPRSLLDCAAPARCILEGDLPRRPAPGQRAAAHRRAGSGLLDFGSVGRIDARAAVRACSGCCWPWTGGTPRRWPMPCWTWSNGPRTWTRLRLERTLGRFAGPARGSRGSPPT